MMALIASSTELSGTTTSISIFGQQAHFVLAPAIHGRVPFLPAVPANLGDGHAGDVQLPEGFLDVVHHVGADDSLDEFHALSFSMRSRSAFSAAFGVF